MLLKSTITLASFVDIVAGAVLPDYRRQDTTNTGLIDADYETVDGDSSFLATDESDIDIDDLEDNENISEINPELDLPNPDLDAIMSTDDSEFEDYTYATDGLVHSEVESSNSTKEVIAQDVTWTYRKKARKINGDKVKGRGIKITNGDKVKRGFYSYQNSCDYIPFKYICSGREDAFRSAPCEIRRSHRPWREQVEPRRCPPNFRKLARVQLRQQRRDLGRRVSDSRN